MTEYRVDELARAAGTSVRNVRVYQERGLLPPPRRVGRTGVYTDTHLARLRLIRLLLQRGYTFATIGELIDAWSAGQGIADLLGLDEAIAVPWSDEAPEIRDEDSLAAGFGTFTAEDLRRAADLGFLDVHDGQVVVPSPRLLEAGAQLVGAGVPLPVVLDLAEHLKSRLDDIARLLFDVFGTHVAVEGRRSAEVAESLLRLRPFAKQTIDAMLSIALTREAEHLLERRAQERRGRTGRHGGTERGSTEHGSTEHGSTEHGSTERGGTERGGDGGATTAPDPSGSNGSPVVYEPSGSSDPRISPEPSGSARRPRGRNVPAENVSARIDSAATESEA